MKSLLKFLSYPKSILGLLFCAFITILYSIVVIITVLLTKKRSVHDSVIRQWATLLLWSLNIKILTEGAEHISDKGAVLLFNHSSLFDIPAVVLGVNKSVRFGAKSELFRIPFFGSAMKNLGVLKITRGNREKVLKVYAESIPSFQKGHSFILAPEGGRRDGLTIHPFKSGPFILAIKAQAPLLPVLIFNVNSVLPRKKLMPMWGNWSTEVRIKILPSISTVGLSQDDRKTLQESVHEIMKSEFEQS
ncbi:MAG: 1-acyl-sn-glycerol-3-phosphate acyltransferase [Bdellovibrionaceae bacterium]|jgi:1-acyl-sn-glycerol-3-phosphate acyltransferase|nr:1-acyl-sn-glycerol-3-phosphate acyltransferase [Pseudobdellovibrionaceae bacterium]